MDKKPVVFIDSGIGGLPYCKDFLMRNPQEEICYLADNANFPYGQRGKEELLSILFTLTEKLLQKINPKIIVLACNTATVSALDSLRRQYPKILFVGTVPAVKPAASSSKCGKVGILGTARTIDDPYNQNIAEKGEKKCRITGIAAPDLVEFIEEHFEQADEKEKKEIVKKYIELFRAEGVDSLVLGCTHFLYLLEEFRQEAAPFIKIFDSLGGVIKRIEHLLDENYGALRAEKNSKPVNRLLLTGAETGSSWQNRAQTLGFTLLQLDTL